MYKKAAQAKLRFSSIRGPLTVEQLFDIPLRSRDGFDLDSIAKNVNADLRLESEESFVEPTKVSSKTMLLTLKLDIIKDVIETRLEQIRQADRQQAKAAERQKILNLIEEKKDEKLSASTIEELQAMLTNLT